MNKKFFNIHSDCQVNVTLTRDNFLRNQLQIGSHQLPSTILFLKQSHKNIYYFLRKKGLNFIV